VVDDDEVAEAREGVGKRDGPRMNRANRRALKGRDFNAIADGRIAQARRGLPKDRRHAAGHGPVECATKRRQRNRDRRGLRSGSEVVHLFLQPLVRQLQLTGELSVEISLGVDLCQQCGPGGERARGSRLRLTRGRLTGQERRNLGVESLPFPLYRVERLTMLRDALLVQAHQGRHGTGGSAKLFTAVAPEEQTGVAGSSTLVDIHELRLQVRELRQSLRFKLLEIIGGLCSA
jgi:hypothetical protein